MPELTSAGLFKEWCPVRGEAWTHPGPGERGHVVRGGGVEGCHNPLGACVVAPSAGGLRRGGCWAGRTLRPGQLADRRRRKDGSAAQVSLMHGPRWPREDCVSLYLEDCRDDGPRWPREDRPRGPGPGVGAGLDVPGRGTGPVAQGRTSRGGSSEPCSRCRRGQPGVEGLPHRRWTTRAIRAHRFPAPGLPVLSRAGAAGRFLRRQPVATGSA